MKARRVFEFDETQTLQAYNLSTGEILTGPPIAVLQKVSSSLSKIKAYPSPVMWQITITRYWAR